MNQPAFQAGDRVIVLAHDEGYCGQAGTIVSVFPSGRCQVAVGKIVLLNLPPEGIKHVESKAASSCGEA